MKVRCVNAKGVRNPYYPPLFEGQIYTVVSEPCDGYFGLAEHQERHVKGLKPAWKRERFTPVGEEFMQSLRELLTPTLEEKRPFLEEIIADRVAGLPV